MTPWNVLNLLRKEDTLLRSIWLNHFLSFRRIFGRVESSKASEHVNRIFLTKRHYVILSRKVKNLLIALNFICFINIDILLPLNMTKNYSSFWAERRRIYIKSTRNSIDIASWVYRKTKSEIMKITPLWKGCAFCFFVKLKTLINSTNTNGIIIKEIKDK